MNKYYKTADGSGLLEIVDRLPGKVILTYLISGNKEELGFTRLTIQNYCESKLLIPISPNQAAIMLLTIGKSSTKR